MKDSPRSTQQLSSIERTRILAESEPDYVVIRCGSEYICESRDRYLRLIQGEESK